MDKQSLNDFELQDTIGVGTVGTIFRARRQTDDQLFALKLLSPAVSRDKLVAARFEREVMILSKLDHPNIVTYHGSGVHEGQVFFLMELLTGGTLKDMLSKHHQLTWLEAAECGRQIAAALQHAHNHGIIHRDLKPGNVFFNDQGEVKLGDFGIARDLHSVDLTETGLTVGTYAYMAPELVRGEREITGNVDLYALGCLLFEMMTGRTPFVGDNFAQIFDQHLKSKPPSLSDLGIQCPSDLNVLVGQLLAKDPNDRPFNARTVQGVLGEVSEIDSRPLANVNDRAASSVRPGQQSLIDRIRGVENRDVSWKAVGGIFAAVIVVLCVIGWFANR